MKQMAPEANAALRCNGTKTVWITCKINNGLLLENAPGSEKYQWIKLRGSRTSPHGLAGVTEVPEDFWKRWEREHDWMDAVRSKLIQSHETREDAICAGFANAAQLTGFERLKGPDMQRIGDGEVTVDPEYVKRMAVLGVDVRMPSAS